ncbi:MAG: glutamate decarboxylase [Spirochaetia bacterium]|jgi:glutamate decarboxylase|nr:glutamate decarboxylase [Spirochaetia bacterium]
MPEIPLGGQSVLLHLRELEYSMKLLDREKKKINADVEHLIKLFIMPDSPDKFIEFGADLLDLIHNFFQEKGGIHSAISLNDLSKLFSDINIPQESHLLKDVLHEIKTKLIAHSVKVGNPYYIGHMTSAIPYYMILLEMIIAALNQNQVKIESAKASTFLEREFVAWMHRLVFNKNPKFYRANIQNRNIALGTVTLDGTFANLTALLVARNRAFPPDGDFPGIRDAGVYEAYKHYGYSKAVIIISQRGHYSIDKVSRIMGLGNNSVIKIPVDSGNKMDTRLLESKCEEIRIHNEKGADRVKIIAIVGIGGTTETGNVDNFREIHRIAAKYDTFFHIDAAWGGGILIIEKYRHILDGIELADSVSIDAHKLMYCPVSMGVAIFRDRKELNNIKHTSNYIIRPDSVDLGRFNIEGTRSFAVLKPWATFQVLGSGGFKLLFDHAFELTNRLSLLVELHPDFESMSTPELFIFTYRFVPKRIQEKIQELMYNTSSEAETLSQISLLGKINLFLNELNIELHKLIREEDESFVSRTMYDSPKYFRQDVVVLRTITVNPLTTSDILKEIIEQQGILGNKLYESEFAERFEEI